MKCLFRPRICLFTGIRLSLFCSTPSSAFAQNSSEMVIRRARRNIADPVQITQMSVGKTIVAPDVPFSADGLWLKDLQVRVRNISDKTIVYGAVQIDFRDLGKPPLVTDMTLGQLPEHALYRNGTRVTIPNINPYINPSIAIKPGEIMTFSLSRDWPSLQERIRAYTPPENVKSCVIDLALFMFSEHTRWVSILSQKKLKESQENAYRPLRMVA